MVNLSKQKRERMIDFLEMLEKEHMDDNEVLRTIGEIENELNLKKYGLVWEKYEEAVDVKMKDYIPVFTEDYDREITAVPGDGYNFLLEGDNLHSLKLLEKTHKGKIDVIYIDPPYNTKNKDFVYDDNLIGTEDGSCHSKWLSFMAERLSLAYNLLSDKGVIFISIDDNEVSQLKLLCDEVFGESRFVAQLVWEKKKKPSFLSNLVANIKEYVLVYCKDRNRFGGLIGEINSATETYPCINATNKRSVCKVAKGIKSNYKEKNYVVKAGTVISGSTMDIKYISDLVIENGIVKKDFEVEGNWRYSADAMYKYSKNKELYITNALYIRRIVSEPRRKLLKDLLPRVGDDNKTAYDDRVDEKDLFKTGWGSNEDADNEMIAIFGTKRVFNYPKPSRLIEKLLCSVRMKDATVLDFFAGSGTTAQAVLELNQEDGGNRHFILCTNNENNICESVTYPRIKTLITGIRPDGLKYSDGYQANLKYFKCDWTPRKSEDYLLSNVLCLHIREMIELQFGIDIDNVHNVLILNKDDYCKYVMNDEIFPQIEHICVNQNIIFNSEELEKLDTLNFKYIPKEFFG